MCCFDYIGFVVLVAFNVCNKNFVARKLAEKYQFTTNSTDFFALHSCLMFLMSCFSILKMFCPVLFCQWPIYEPAFSLCSSQWSHWRVRPASPRPRRRGHPGGPQCHDAGGSTATASARKPSGPSSCRRVRPSPLRVCVSL